MHYKYLFQFALFRLFQSRRYLIWPSKSTPPNVIFFYSSEKLCININNKNNNNIYLSVTNNWHCCGNSKTKRSKLFKFISQKKKAYYLAQAVKRMKLNFYESQRVALFNIFLRLLSTKVGNSVKRTSRSKLRVIIANQRKIAHPHT